jgi:hypothetical protein
MPETLPTGAPLDAPVTAVQWALGAAGRLRLVILMPVFGVPVGKTYIV